MTRRGSRAWQGSPVLFLRPRSLPKWAAAVSGTALSPAAGGRHEAEMLDLAAFPPD